MRISGITIPDNKRVDISLSYIYGIGRSNVEGVLSKAQVDAKIRVKDLSEEEQKRIIDVLATMRLEGDLRAEVTGNIKGLQEMGSYRGQRQFNNLLSRGKRTRSNARTKGGKRLTIGAIKKEVAAKMEASTTAKAKVGK